jgi:hypothetical protein
MSNARLQLAFAVETMPSLRTAFFSTTWGTSRFATPLHAHRPTEVRP